jgi:hypothetical protein
VYLSSSFGGQKRSGWFSVALAILFLVEGKQVKKSQIFFRVEANIL